MNDERGSDLPEERGLVVSLALLPEKSLLDEAHLAAALQVSPRTVRRMVGRSQLPPPVQLGGRSFWMVGKVLQHIESALERRQQDEVKDAPETATARTMIVAAQKTLNACR